MTPGLIGEKALGYQQITNLSTAVALTVPPGTCYAVVQAESQPVRWRDDGTDPTASVGMRIVAGDGMEYTAAALAKIKFIEETPSAKLNASYYGVAPGG